MLAMSDVNLKNQRVLIRQDLNVPLENGEITNVQRLTSSLPTLNQALEAGAAVMVMSHLGRPDEGQYDQRYSMKPVADWLKQQLDYPVHFIDELGLKYDSWVQGIDVKPGELVVTENVRFLKGEKSNETALSQKLAALCDVFVMDAFGTAHRAQASTYGVAEYAPIACAGPLLQAEVASIMLALRKPRKPMVAIVGGSKVSTKLQVLTQLIDKVDQLIVGGGIANTFIKAQGFNIGQSLVEDDLLDTARELIQKAQRKGASIPIPVDVVCAKKFDKAAKATVKAVSDVDDDDMILDIGPASAAQLAQSLSEAKTIVWNGPLGVFEFPAFAAGTQTVAEAIAASNAFSLAGGGDTLAAIDQFHIADQISYISTGGGAFLEMLEGKTLPAVQILMKRQTQQAASA